LKNPDDPNSYNWRDDALCAQIGPELWFPEKGEKAREAKAFCHECPVKDFCLDYVLSDPSIQHGIWAGLTPREIRDLRRKRGLEGAELPEDMEPDDETVYG
jgi:WhiB family redox-sensing transcriptional regulator